MIAAAGKSANPHTAPARLFVYGTLKQGHPLHRYLRGTAGVEYIGSARTRGKLYHLPRRAYPGATPSDREGDILYGELYHISQPELTLKRLDRIEGCNEGLFERRRVSVWANGAKTKAWVYFYARPLGRAVPIPTGNYVKPGGSPASRP